MPKEPKQIKFQNKQNPKASFDLITLEDLFRREGLDHKPWELHRVNFYAIILITKGSGRHTIDFQDHQYKKGTVITIRKDQLHRFHRNKSVMGFLMLFMDEFLLSYLEQLEALKTLQLFNEILGDPVVQLSHKQLQTALLQVERIKEEYLVINDEQSLGIIRSELHILIARLFRLKAAKTAGIKERQYLREFINFQNYVETHASEKHKVKDYAKLMGLSSKTLNKVVRSIVNQSAKNFIDEIRIKQMKRLLIQTDLRVQEIAYASGIEETSNFFKFFKRITMLTPEQFRNSQK